MMNKISFGLGIGVGYVLGTRAGEKRYEQIKKQADKAWQNPKVQETVTTATETVKAKAPVVASVVGHKAAEVAKDGTKAAAGKAADAASSVKDTTVDKASQAKHAVKNNGDEDLPETIHRGEDGELHADTSGFGPGAEKLP